MLIRCSALRLYNDRSSRQNAGLSETAKKVVEDEIRTLYFGVREKSAKAMQKALIVNNKALTYLTM